VLRTGAEASAPVLFGLLADNAAGGGEAGLRVAFLVTLPALAINAGLLLLAARTYPREVAAVAASTGAHPRRRCDTHLTADHHGALDDDQPLNRPRALGSAAGCAENSGVFDGGGLAPDTSG
jgi:hypothetical protein